MSVLDGRVTLVTGANHGIGAATAIELARLGGDSGVSYLRLAPDDDDAGRPAAYVEQRARNADHVATAVTAAGRRCVAIEADLSDPAAPERLFDQVEAELGPVDILVNNASGWRKDSFVAEGHDAVGRRTDLVTAASVDAQLLVDARAGALLIAQFARRHRSRGATWGRIISLTSGEPQGFPGEVSYGAAKAALENYTMSAATELGDSGIAANVVYPPVTDTGWVTDAVREFVRRSPDHMHIASPEDVAEVIAWLCTNAARLVTGNVIRLR